jgi:hypothetical protein
MLSRLIPALMLAIVSHSAFAAELFMYRREGCSWCLAWDREIGPVYGKTPAGKRVPLRLVDLDRERPGVTLKTPVLYTPTFVVVENGREIGRMEGYVGEHFFWGMLDNLLRDLPAKRPDDPPA